MQAQLRLGRIFRVQIGLHYSWLLIVLLVTLSLVGEFSTANPQWGAGLIWAMAIITVLLLVVSIMAHELSHVAVAKARGLPLHAITLFAFGGVAQIGKEAADAKTEFWMGIVGPLTSAIIGFACLGLALAFGWAPPEMPRLPLLAMLMWLGVINIMLAIFNMLPCFPLDGGRVLRAIVWWATGDVVRATRIAARVGQLLAFGLVVIGIFRFFYSAGFGGLWLAFIGWFLLKAARATGAQMEISESLRGVTVGAVMASDCPMVDSHDNLQTFADEHHLRTGQHCFAVEENGHLVGIITPHEVKGVARVKWPYTTVDDVMRSLDQLRTVTPHTPVTEALELMGREDVNQLPVIQDGRLAGIISRSHILRILQTR